MRKTALAPGQFCILFTWRKVAMARRVTRCCAKGYPPLEVAPGQRKTHVNGYRHQIVHRGKVYPGVIELPLGNELSRDHVNRPSVFRKLEVRNTVQLFLCFCSSVNNVNFQFLCSLCPAL